jgi:putative DNA primase/helicase
VYKNINFEKIATHALRNTSYIARILPSGTRYGRELKAGDIYGGKGQSFSLNLDSGAWADFAEGISGGDIIDLIVARDGIGIDAAAEQIATDTGCAHLIQESQAPPPHKPAIRKIRKTEKVPQKTDDDMAHLWADAPAELPHKNKNLPEAPIIGEPTEFYEYSIKDTSGNWRTSYFVGRWEKAGCRKSIRPFYRDRRGDIIVKMPPGTEKTLYNLQKVECAKFIVIVEGEQKADILADMDICATCNTGGANKWKDEYSQLLKGKTIAILPDNDDPGREHAEHVAKSLEGIAESIKIVALPGLPHKGDIVQWLQVPGNDKESLQALINDAPFRMPRAAVPAPPRKEAHATPAPLYGYEMRTDCDNPGLYYMKKAKKDEEEDIAIWLCAPFEILAKTRDKLKDYWGILVKYADSENTEHQHVIPADFFADPSQKNWLGGLLRRGWQGNLDSKAVTYLRNYMYMQKTSAYITALQNTGWDLDGGYLLGNEYIVNQNAAATDEKVIWQNAPEIDPYASGGTLDEWRATVGRWCVGNSRLTMAVCAALAAPLIEIAGADSFGFNIVGLSSTGKTTALAAAASVYGKGCLGGYIESWRATGNALENIAAKHCDSLLCIDEMAQVSAATLADSAYTIMNGSGKARLKRDGSSQHIKKWRTLLLSSGEIGLELKAEECANLKVRGGQMVRIIDIPSDAGAEFGIFENLHEFATPSELSKAIKKAAGAHYGHIARALIHYINSGDNRGKIESGLKKINISDICPPGASEQVERVAWHFMLCAFAGCIMPENIFTWPDYTPIQEQEAYIMNAIKSCFNAWIESRGGVGTYEQSAIISQVTKFIENNGTSRFQAIGEDEALCINRVGYRQKNDDFTVDYYCFPESFKKDICRGFNHETAIKILMDAKILQRGSDSKIVSRLGRSGVDAADKRKFCYVLRFPDFSNIEGSA